MWVKTCFKIWTSLSFSAFISLKEFSLLEKKFIINKDSFFSCSNSFCLLSIASFISSILFNKISILSVTIFIASWLFFYRNFYNIFLSPNSKNISLDCLFCIKYFKITAYIFSFFIKIFDISEEVFIILVCFRILSSNPPLIYLVDYLSF